MMKNSLQIALKLIKDKALAIPPAYLPKMKFDKFEIRHIKHQKGEVLDVIDMRMALFAGIKPVTAKLLFNWTEMQLLIDGSRWMSTHPTENFWQIAPASLAHGKVLVGGLGLGYFIYELLSNKSVKKIYCVEIEKRLVDMMKLCFSILTERLDNAPQIEFICADIENYLTTTSEKFDFIYLDTWTGTGEETLNNTVLPLRKLARPLIKNNPDENLFCWAEEVMRGQVEHALIGRCLYPKPFVPTKEFLAHKKKWSPVEYAFFKNGHFENMPKDQNEQVEYINKFVESFEL